MRARICLVVVVMLLCLATAEPTGAPLKKELAELQGVWRLIGFEVDGKEAYLMEEKQPRWVIKGDKVFYGGEELAVLVVDPTTMPKCINLDFLKPKRVHEGIYAIDKDTLKICVNRMTEGMKERPVDFATKGKDQYRTMLFKRDKPGTEFEGVTGYVGIQLSFDADKKEVLIADVLEDSPAKKAGLKKGDVLLRVAGTETTTVRQTVDLVRPLKPGSEAILRIRRAGKEQDITVKVGVLPFVYLE